MPCPEPMHTPVTPVSRVAFTQFGGQGQHVARARAAEWVPGGHRSPVRVELVVGDCEPVQLVDQLTQHAQRLGAATGRQLTSGLPAATGAAQRGTFLSPECDRGDGCKRGDSCRQHRHVGIRRRNRRGVNRFRSYRIKARSQVSGATTGRF